MFLRQGYEGATLDEIAARARISKITIYRRFSDKADLFRHVVARSSDVFLEDIESILESGPGLEDALLAVASLHLRLILGDSGANSPVLNLSRLLIAEAPRFPELAKAAMELVQQSFGGHLRDYFQGLKAAGVIDVDDPEIAAQIFLNSLLSVSGALVDPSSIPSLERRERFVREAVRLFLNGALPR